MTKETYAVITAYSDFGDKCSCTLHSVHTTHREALAGAKEVLEEQAAEYHDDSVLAANWVAEGVERLTDGKGFVTNESDDEPDAAIYIKTPKGDAWT
tara:strand:- start:192 stop:482 length:291 start_codon:yes stop_codon:yes gene_type:complete